MLSLGVTDFILLHPCGEHFTGYQLMRVIFKVLLLTFMGVNNLIPAYLSDFLIKYFSGRENRHSEN